MTTIERGKPSLSWVDETELESLVKESESRHRVFTWLAAMEACIEAVHYGSPIRHRVFTWLAAMEERSRLSSTAAASARGSLLQLFFSACRVSPQEPLPASSGRSTWCCPFETYVAGSRSEASTTEPEFFVRIVQVAPTLVSRQPDSFRGLGQRFVELVRSLPQVRQVLAETSAGKLRIWTLIEAVAFDWEQRRPVYDAQLAVVEAHPEVAVDFDLVNLAEYPGMEPDELLPHDAEVLWQR